MQEAARRLHIEAYNKKDPARIIELFTQDGSLVDSDNVATRGRDAIVQEFTAAFAEPVDLHARREDRGSISLITPDVAQAEDLSAGLAQGGHDRQPVRRPARARKGDAWRRKIAPRSATTCRPPASRPTSGRLRSSNGWSANGSMKARTFRSTRPSGGGRARRISPATTAACRSRASRRPAVSLIIAWDPQAAARSRSWIFNADGSRGDARSWTRATNNQWVVKARRGSTDDGQPTSATYKVISYDPQQGRHPDQPPPRPPHHRRTRSQPAISTTSSWSANREAPTRVGGDPAEARDAGAADDIARVIWLTFSSVGAALGCSRRSASFSQQCWF